MARIRWHRDTNRNQYRYVGSRKFKPHVTEGRIRRSPGRRISRNKNAIGRPGRWGLLRWK